MHDLQPVPMKADRSTTDLPRLKHTERIVMEAMRLYPPAYVIGREALEDCAIGGYSLPAGHTVLMSQWVVHRDPRWFPEPQRFDPDRWADERAARVPRYAYFPFGGGPRLCIGNAFALMEAVLVLATVAREYHFTLDPSHPVVLQPLVTLRPRDGLRAPLRRRRQPATVPG